MFREIGLQLPRSGVQRTPRFGSRERKVRYDEDRALIQIESRSPKEFAKKIRDGGTGGLGEKRLTGITVDLPQKNYALY